MKSSATLRLTSPSSSASRISPSAASRCSALSFPCPRRFLKALCSFSVSVSNMILRFQHRSLSLGSLCLSGASLVLRQCLRPSRLIFLLRHETADLGHRHGPLDEGKSPFFLHLSRRGQQTTQSGACEHAARTDPADTRSFKLRDRERESPNAGKSIHRPWRNRCAYDLDRFQIRQPRRVQHLGASLGKRLKTPDRIVEIAAFAEEVFSARRQRKRKRQRACGLDCCGDALDRKRVVVNWMAVVAACIFHRSAYDSRGSRQANRLCDSFRIVAETIFQIRSHRQIGRLDNRPAMREHIVASQRSVVPAQRKRKTCTGRRQGLKTQPSQNSRAAGVPGIRNDECAYAAREFWLDWVFKPWRRPVQVLRF